MTEAIIFSIFTTDASNTGYNPQISSLALDNANP